MVKFFIFIISFSLISCVQKNYDRYFNGISARNLQGERFYLSQIPEKVLILNFYSPICVPCIEELPALHLIYEESKKYDFMMFLGVEPNLEKNISQIPDPYKNKDFNEESFLYLANELKKEVQIRNIEIPFIILDPPFRIDTKEFITGTPETLIFTTNPLRLRYNFIGPIATSTSKKEILNNSRFQFFLQLLKTLHQNINSNNSE